MEVIGFLVITFVGGYLVFQGIGGVMVLNSFGSSDWDDYAIAISFILAGSAMCWWSISSAPFTLVMAQ